MAAETGYNLSHQIDIVKLAISKPDFPDQEVDLLNVLENFIIYEDIFQQAISAKIVLSNQINLVGVLPIVGGEKINIKFRTPIYDKFIDLNFIVYRVGDRKFSEDNANIQVDVLYLCTEEMWWAVSNDVSMGIQGTYTDIIKKMLSLFPGTTKKTIDSEDTVGIFTYVVPMINVFKAIKFCAARSVHSSYAPYFFWESADGFHFKNYKTLSDNAAVKSIFIGDRNIAQQDSDPEKLFCTALDFEYLESNNRMDQNMNGSFGGKYFVVDLISKTIDMKEYDYNENFTKNNVHLEGFPLNDDTKSIRGKYGFINTNPDGSHICEWHTQSIVDMLSNVRFMVSIPGDSGLKVGDTVWLYVPSKVGHEIEHEVHTTGKYLITSMKHLIRKESYTQVLELCKDSFAANVRKNEVTS